MGEVNAPIGIAWNRAMIEIPSMDLWGPDGAHQSLAGSYLTAAVLFETVFRDNATDIDYDGGLDSATARTYRRIAFETVRDSTAQTGLAGIIPVIDANGNVLTATAGFATYDWYRNGQMEVSGSSNVLVASGSGCYQVVAATPDGCEQRSPEVCLTLTSVSGMTEPLAKVNIYPNPASDVLYIKTESKGPMELFVYDAAGRLLSRDAFNDGRLEMKVAELSSGLYSGRLKSAGGTHSFRFMVSHK